MDFMTGLKRADYCGSLRLADVGREVTVAGWVQRQRDLGALIFVDLRDREGIVQLAFDESTPKEIFDKAFGVRSEYVLMAKGVVRERSSKNADIPTGDIEIEVTDLRVLAKSETPPFEIVENCQTSELTRLKYRYLDLRRPDLQKNILMRHKIAPSSSAPPPRAQGIISSPAVCIRASSTPCRSPRSSISSSQWSRASTAICR